MLGRGSRCPDGGSWCTRRHRDLGVPEATFAGPGLRTLLGLDALGVTVVGRLLALTRVVVGCRVPIGCEDPFCKACGVQGVSRGTVARRLAHVLVGWRPAQLVVRVRRLAYTRCHNYQDRKSVV